MVIPTELHPICSYCLGCQQTNCKAHEVCIRIPECEGEQ